MSQEKRLTCWVRNYIHCRDKPGQFVQTEGLYGLMISVPKPWHVPSTEEWSFPGWGQVRRSEIWVACLMSCLWTMSSWKWACNPPHPENPTQSLHRGVSVHCVEGQEGGKAAAYRLEGPSSSPPSIGTTSLGVGKLRAKTEATWRGVTKGVWLKQVLGDSQELQRAATSVFLQHD